MKNILRSVASSTLFKDKELVDLYTLFKVKLNALGYRHLKQVPFVAFVLYHISSVTRQTF